MRRHKKRAKVVFLSTLSLRRATKNSPALLSNNQFLSTLSLRRATLAGPSGPAFLYNFYPRSPCGERPPKLCGIVRHTYFYPRSPCGERPDPTAGQAPKRKISIHALLAESDHLKSYLLQASQFISIHALLAESDEFFPTLEDHRKLFLSTLSLRRATTRGASRAGPKPYFYPRSPCGERPETAITSIGDIIFLSTLSLRRATLAGLKLVKADTGISIHALLAESDKAPPYNLMIHHAFLSTLSLRRATPASVTPAASRRNFYPRSPCGERLGAMQIVIIVMYFYPRSPCGERLDISARREASEYFYPRSPCGERLM